MLQGRQAEAAMASAPQLAAGLVGQRLWIKWPFMQEAIVQAVSDPTCKVCVPPPSPRPPPLPPHVGAILTFHPLIHTAGLSGHVRQIGLPSCITS